MHNFFKANLFHFLFLIPVCYSLVLGCQGIKSISPKPNNTEGYFGESKKENVIVFIHGLFGSPQQSWRNDHTGAYWPNLIRMDPEFQDFAIYLIGYSSPKLAKASTIEEIATREVQKLKDNGVFENHHQIYFLTHSMGGLIAKRMLVKLHLPDPEKLKMLDKVRAVVFLSTPSQGSEMAKIVSQFSPNPQPNDLESATHNSFLQSLENEWQNLLLDRAKGVSYPKSFCAYETKSTLGLMIVNRVNASTMCDNNPYAMDLNHIEIAKPTNDKVDPYKWVKARILDVASTNGISRIDLLMKKLEATTVGRALRIEDRNIPIGGRELSFPSVTGEGRMSMKTAVEPSQITDGEIPITSLVFNVGRWRFATPAIKRYLTELSQHHKFKFAVFLQRDQYRGWMPASQFLNLFYSDPENITQALNTGGFFTEFSDKLYTRQVNAGVSALIVKEKLKKTGEPGIAVLDNYGELKGIASKEGIDSQILNQVFSTKTTNDVNEDTSLPVAPEGRRIFKR